MTEKEKQEKITWLKGRRKGIGGSDVAAIFGLSPWRTQLDVFNDKTDTSEPVIEGASIPLRIGMELEDLVARMYAEQTGYRVQRYAHTLSDETNHLIGDVDRVIIRDAEHDQSLVFKLGDSNVGYSRVLECKTASVDWGDDVPLYYQLQVQTYMHLTGAKVADIAVLNVVSKDFKIYEIKRDDEVIKSICDKAKDWWESHVIALIPPSPSTPAEAASVFNRETDTAIVADDVIAKATQEYKECKAKIKSLESELDAYSVCIMSFMGENNKLFNENGDTMATWRKAKDTSKINWENAFKNLAKQLAVPEQQAEEIVKENTSIKEGARRFLVK